MITDSPPTPNGEKALGKAGRQTLGNKTNKFQDWERPQKGKGSLGTLLRQTQGGDLASSRGAAKIGLKEDGRHEGWEAQKQDIARKVRVKHRPKRSDEKELNDAAETGKLEDRKERAEPRECQGIGVSDCIGAGMCLIS